MKPYDLELDLIWSAEVTWCIIRPDEQHRLHDESYKGSVYSFTAYLVVEGGPSNARTWWVPI